MTLCELQGDQMDPFVLLGKESFQFSHVILFINTAKFDKKNFWTTQSDSFFISLIYIFLTLNDKY